MFEEGKKGTGKIRERKEWVSGSIWIGFCARIKMTILTRTIPAKTASEKLWRNAMMIIQEVILNRKSGIRIRKPTRLFVSSWTGLTVQQDPIKIPNEETMEVTMLNHLRSSFTLWMLDTDVELVPGIKSLYSHLMGSWLKDHWVNGIKLIQIKQVPNVFQQPTL